MIKIDSTNAIADSLAALIECSFDDLSEKFFVAIEMLYIVADETNDTTLDLRWWVEYIFVNSEEIVDIVVSLKENGENAIILVARTTSESLSYFALKHANDLWDEVFIVENMEKDLA